MKKKSNFLKSIGDFFLGERRFPDSSETFIKIANHKNILRNLQKLETKLTIAKKKSEDINKLAYKLDLAIGVGKDKTEILKKLKKLTKKP